MKFSRTCLPPKTIWSEYNASCLALSVKFNMWISLGISCTSEITRIPYSLSNFVSLPEITVLPMTLSKPCSASDASNIFTDSGREVSVPVKGKLSRCTWHPISLKSSIKGPPWNVRTWSWMWWRFLSSRAKFKRAAGAPPRCMSWDIRISRWGLVSSTQRATLCATFWSRRKYLRTHRE